MKKYLLFLTASLTLTVSYGQSSFVFVDSTGTWSVATTFPHGSSQFPNFVETTTKTYGFKGDTLINSVLWRQMFSTPDTNFSSSPNLKAVGYARAVNNLVLFIDTLADLDTIYDFNLQVGDSVFYNFIYDSAYIHVSKVDSVVISGNIHKRFFFTEPAIPSTFTYLGEIWLEGIGSLHGPLNSRYPHLRQTSVPDSVILTCYKSDTIMWSNPYYNACNTNILLSNKDLAAVDNKVSIYPNPFPTQTTLQTANRLINASLTVYNSVGQTVKHVDNLAGQTVTFHRDNLPSGLYFVRLTQDGNTISSDKFVITDK
jgi:hypothetical protein